MYDPSLGRWLTEDPIGFDAGDPNFYRYVGNNPVRFVDPSGLCAEEKCPESYKVSKELAKVLDDAWRLTEKGKVEHGGSIIIDKDGKLIYRPTKPGETDSIPADHFPQPGPGEQWGGSYHTHPHKPTTTNGPPSLDDMVNLAKGIRGDVSVIRSKDCIFVLVVCDKKRANALANDKRIYQTMLRDWLRIFQGDKGTADERAEEALLSTLRGMGVAYYKACRTKPTDPIPTDLTRIYPPKEKK